MLNPKHLREWQASAVDQEIIDLNVVSLEGQAAYNYLLYSNKIKRRNDGRVVDSVLRTYQHCENGGWWCSSIDIFTGYDSQWGCFKPNEPRVNSDDKTIKYEHPPKTETEIFALQAPDRIWELISRRYDVLLPENYQSLSYGDFWRWVIGNPQIPIIVTEGAKKAAAILSAGYVAIGLPGVWGSYRQPRLENGESCGDPYLIPQIKAFAQEGRRFYFCFDQEERRETRKNVNFAIAKTSKLLVNSKCEVKILNWLPTLGKGIDDVLAVFGREKFDEIYRDALTLDAWNVIQLKQLTYNPDLELNQRYLGNIDIPQDAQFIGIKSPKGTGKNYSLVQITDPVIRSGEKRVLVLSHRVQLGIGNVERLGLSYVTEIRESGQGSHFGMGLCVDSLHPKSQAKFSPDEWKGCWLIIDEVMQLLRHTLSSSTCAKDRVAILSTLKRLLINIVAYGGKIFVLDADLSDIAIDFIKKLIGQDIRTFIVENKFKFNEPWQVNVVDGKNPAKLITILDQKIEKGEKVFVCLSAQKPKSRWGSYTLEKRYQKKYPHLRILRIDSDTTQNPKHPAYGCSAHLNEVVKDYDLVLTTATIETGVSIEAEHFDCVFGIFQGLQTTDSVRQHLSRYRPPVPRFIWMNGIGINKSGNGSSSVKSLLSAEYSKDKFNLKRLSELGFEENIDGTLENTHISAWAKLAAIDNYGMQNYRKQILEDLASEGHIIVNYSEAIEELLISETKAEIDQNRDEVYSEYRENVAASESITDEQFLKLDKQRCKTESEQLKYRKAELERRYNVDVTPDLIEKDDNRWHSKVRLHYYLSEGREFLPDREKGIMSSALNNGNGQYFLVDTNRNLLGNRIDTLDKLRIDELLQVNEISNESDLAISIFEKTKKHSYDLKTLLGIDFSKAKSPIECCKRLLELIGYKLPLLRKQGKRKEQIRVYGTPAPDFERDDENKIILVDGHAVPVNDRREEVFKAWVERDILLREKAILAKREAETLAAMAIRESAKPAEAYQSAGKVVALPTLVEQKTVTSANELPKIQHKETNPNDKKCWFWYGSSWREGIVKSWDDRPHEKFFKALVEFCDCVGTTFVWHRNWVHLWEEAA